MSSRAVIFCAGQGKRLHPHTVDRPKCLTVICGQSILDRQLDTLEAAGVEEVIVVTGFRDALVLQAIRERPASRLRITPVHNPFYSVAENIASAWLAKDHLAQGAFVLNGDTLICEEIVRRLRDQAAHPITLCSDVKGAYDDDDMKLSLSGDHVVALGKRLPAADTGAEAIGLALLSEEGAALFNSEVETLVREPAGLSHYYLAAIQRAADKRMVGHVSIRGYDWCEIDFPRDIDLAEMLVSGESERRTA